VVRFQAGATDNSLLQSIQTGSVTQSACYPICTGDSFHTNKAAGCVVNHLLLRLRMHEAIPPLHMSVWCLIKHRRVLLHLLPSFRCIALRNVDMCFRCECHMHSWYTNYKDPDGTAISGHTLCAGIPSRVQGARNRWHWCHAAPPCHGMRGTGPAEQG
jgi:hypothetical protein